jgi:tetratricopeptide (TPR) repeat protein
MIKRTQLFLGPARSRAFILWLGITGLASLILNVIVNQYGWVRPVQSLIVVVFLIGTAIIFGGRLAREERGRWFAILLPAVVALLFALFIAPQYGALLIGGSLGWIVAATLLTRVRMPMQYREAVKHLRKSEYAEAVKVMDRVIKEESDEPNHYRFRAEVLRVWGKLDRAVRDYQKMTQLAPNSAVAFNGLSEVYMQMGEYNAALNAARKANEIVPDDWVTYYNLGMIEDRQQQSQDAVEHLQKALALKVPDTRHRVLIYFYLARAYARLGDMTSAHEQLKAIRKLPAGLEEWEMLLESTQSETLRAVLGDDVADAQALLDGELELADLAHGTAS